jgi:hypothetical protein
MELAPIIRLAWRRRLALALGVAVALAVGLALGRGPAAHQGVATMRLLLDTPASQLVAASPKGADSLVWRAEWLANLMTSRDARLRIARGAGVAPDQLAVISPSLSFPVLPATLPRRASKGADATAAPYVVTVLADPTLPIVSLQARAGSAAAAARLATAVATEIKLAAAPAPDVQQAPFVVEDVETLQPLDEISGSHHRRGAAAGVAALLAWCAAALGSGLRAGIRAAA